MTLRFSEPPRRVLLSSGWALALLVVLWLVYRVAFGAPFYLDSWAHLQDKTNLHLETLSWRGVWDAMHLDYGGKLYRPLANLSLAFTYYFAELSPRAYRVGNVAIHWLATLSLALCFFCCLRSPRAARAHPALARSALWAAVLGASLWSLHPVQTNAVTYVVQRMTSLAGLFTFLSVAAYVRARSSARGWSWPWSLAALVSFALAAASKENGLLVPVLAALAEGFLLDPPTPAWARRVRVAGLVCALCGAGLLAWKGPAAWAWLQAAYRARPFTMGQRLLTEARLQVQYLLVLLVPDPRLLTLDAEVEVSRGFLQPPATAAAVASLAILSAGAALVQRRLPLLAFGVFWFLAGQALEATILPLELYFEHRLYAPSAFLYLGAAALALAAFRRPGAARALSVAAVGAALVVGAWATHSRNVTWSKPVAFWDDAVAKAPGKGRPRLNLGMALVDVGLYAEAEKTLREAERLGAEKPLVYYNLADVATRLGREDDARRYLEEVTRYGGAYAYKANGWLALKALKREDLGEARARLATALAQKPRDAELWRLAGELFLRSGDAVEAERAWRTSLRFDPGQPDVRERLAEVVRGRTGAR